MKIYPLGARILVGRLTVTERTTESGIIMPERSAPPTYKNRVMEVGPDITKGISRGDVVLTTQFVGDEVRDQHKSYFLVHEDDVLAVIDEEANGYE